jgi:superfamily II DNA or RNA helicase
MATGTGKTITSLNCLLQIYKRYHYYKAIILVPTITLVEQWENECKKFNFTNITKVCSKYKGWQAVIDNLKMIELSNPNNDVSYIIISTYASFIRPSLFSDLNALSRRNLLLIADEAHNMGSHLISQRLDNIKYLRRIGLSATPERQFDDAGNKKLMTFFGCNDEYTFEYSMDKAIHTDPPALCKYLYYPHIVRLTVDEMYSYIDISQKIAKIANFDDDISQEKLKKLLLIRKQIIHKAVNKKEVFKEILTEHLEKYHSLKYTLVYVPEGNTPDETADIFDTRESIADDAESLHLINEYTAIVRDLDPHITVKQFTSESKERESMLKDFAEGNLDVLTSMKCLDEGVDVPRSELAIFCASTGNPRQFIQRRGRVLRLHKDKKRAIIHDLIVIPDEGSITEDCFEIEKSLVETEIKRVRDFALLSENSNETLKTLDDVLNYYQISLFS